MIKIIIDADPGVDDAFAILLAANEEKLKIEGITTVAGNCSLEDATNNTFTILNLCQRLDIPVYKGCNKALEIEEVDALDVHGSNGLGGINFEKVEKEVEKEHAVDYLISKAKENKGEITIVAIGPLTNIARAIKKDSNFASNVKSLIVMGGGINIGNITKYAEFNFYKDPQAAKIVFESNFKEIIMMGLDVTTKLPLKEKYEKMLNSSEEYIAKVLYDITRNIAEFDRKKNKTEGAIINDPITIAHLIDESIVKIKPANVDVVISGEEIGKTNVNFVDKSNIKVAYDVDSNRFYDLLFSKILKNYKTINKD